MYIYIHINVQVIPETGPMKFVDRPHDVVEQQHKSACVPGLSLFLSLSFLRDTLGGATGNANPARSSLVRPSAAPLAFLPDRSSTEHPSSPASVTTTVPLNLPE